LNLVQWAACLNANEAGRSQSAGTPPGCLLVADCVAKVVGIRRIAKNGQY